MQTVLSVVLGVNDNVWTPLPGGNEQRGNCKTMEIDLMSTDERNTGSGTSVAAVGVVIVSPLDYNVRFSD